eukprot:817774-Rhodomonas_salina.1
MILRYTATRVARALGTEATFELDGGTRDADGRAQLGQRNSAHHCLPLPADSPCRAFARVSHVISVLGRVLGCVWKRARVTSRKVLGHVTQAARSRLESC